MKRIWLIISVTSVILSCNVQVKKEFKNQLPIEGTWHLLSGQTILKSDTVFTDYTRGQKMIKIINKTHFAFLRHDLNGGKDSAAVYSAGGGTYSLKDDQYTENLEYFSDRGWEGNSFHFTIEISNDTLIQTGREKIDSLGIDQIIIEKYIRVK